MKNKFLLLIFSVLILPLEAQFTIDNGNFPVGGLSVGRAYSLASTAVLGTTGGGQFFDLGGLSPIYHDSIIYYSASATPWASYHPGASVCNVEKVNNLVYVYFYTATTNVFMRSGLTVIGDFGAGLDTVHGNYSPVDTTLSTDYSYGHSETEFSKATINNLIPFADYKTYIYKNITVDAWGSLRTPLNYYPNVLRVKYAEFHYDTVFYLSTPIYITDDSLYYYKFYAEDTRCPVVTAHTDSSFNLQYLEYIYTSPVILGCMDSTAQNYNPLANQSDGSCTYCSINYSITPDTTICQGSSVTLNVSGGSSYLWSDGSTSSSLSVTPDSTTVYSVYISTSPQCHVLGSVIVTVDQPVMANFWTAHNTYAVGDNIQFVNLSDNASWYQWDLDDAVNGTSTLEFPEHVYTITGEKHIILISGNSCFSDTVSDTLLIIPSSGIESSMISEQFRVYPNPGSDVIFIEGEVRQQGEMNVYTTDMLCRQIQLISPVDVSGDFSIRANVSELPPGIYILEIYQHNSSVRIKWIKM